MLYFSVTEGYTVKDVVLLATGPSLSLSLSADTGAAVGG